MIRNTRRSAMVVAAAVLSALGLLYAVLTWSDAAPWGGGDYKLSVLASTAGAMGPGVAVRISGQRVGRVTAIERKGAMALIEMQIEDAKVPLPEDTKARVRLRTLVGENYLELAPGTSSRTLPSGSALAASQPDDYVEADEVLSVLRGETRERARETIRNLGAGVDGQGARLNSFLQHAAGAVENAADVTAVLAKDRQQVASLVEDVGHLTRAIGDRTQSLVRAAWAGRETFEILSARDDQVREVLEQLPSTMRQVRSTSSVLGSVTGEAAPVLFDVAEAVRELRPAVNALDPAADEGLRVLRAVSAAAPKLEGTLRRVRKLPDPTVAALPQIRATLCQLNPIVDYAGPYARALTNLLQNMGSATNFYDATGHAARLYAMVGQGSFSGTGKEIKSGFEALFKAGLLGRNVPNGYNPYTAPGGIAKPIGGRGAFGPSSATDVKYQRVKADC